MATDPENDEIQLKALKDCPGNDTTSGQEETAMKPASVTVRRGCLSKKKLKFIYAWIIIISVITLIALITTLCLYLLLQKQLGEKEQENSQLQKQLGEKEQENSQLQKQLGEKEQENSQLQKQLGEKEQVNSQLQKQLSEKELENSQLQTKYNSEICFSRDTNKTVRGVFGEQSWRDGVVMKPVWAWIREAAVDVTLDPDTAQPSLILSEDGKRVRLGDTRQNLPDNPKRFDPVVSVLGKEGFSSGRFYYEVQVGEKTDWDVGMAKESINRKGSIKLNPGNGYWTVWLRNGTEYRALADPSVLLPLREKPRTLGVYVDYERGQVSFYNVETRSHVYSFSGYNFTEKLYPFFSPHLLNNGKNSAPLIISFVK
ncbi:hypothetical protein AGOR_G00111370 [Albula goreensis]|uniref:B30.2/SPRY domain-containing protein n=1 Tax=Albula goreensis TaxID=1534307 RepID=A0A8T3DIE9_9TELE|nr:hypothetical protein AGOR_G00111370 [Albula goreensis]